ncbi:aminodeoxychorismate/anthranilate synthase component II [Flavobacterium agricola]|uniref:Aminodeoxychorismate/anthranilate synthase component II n=1 Tax=Flavobacterium agricola TaxID=2870839 RepID=A0ABY6LZD6_9FLAO|nr:aminodeoxychorismate/anthranilate synthase component II [Flavobacterium agricola]UYW01604.1 aminodeoxychorismate/anthranilate synthase component II [Flavobacterium agricola]
MKKIVVIDNYDSFTYNLVHYLEELNGQPVTVYRNDEFELEELEKFDKILLSPGPGIPDEAGLLKAVIQKYYKTKSILGVCLGQQAIGEVFGGELENLAQVFHGIATPITVLDNSEVLFQNLDSQQQVGRYHSWVVANRNFPEQLVITAVDANNQIMALRHKDYDVRGVQFHPESILTPQGKAMLQNWINH